MCFVVFYLTIQIDSVMSTRLASENDASRRLKSEFLIQFDGVTSYPDDLVIVIGKHIFLFWLFNPGYLLHYACFQWKYLGHSYHVTIST